MRAGAATTDDTTFMETPPPIYAATPGTSTAMRPDMPANAAMLMSVMICSSTPEPGRPLRLFYVGGIPCNEDLQQDRDHELQYQQADKLADPSLGNGAGCGEQQPDEHKRAHADDQPGHEAGEFPDHEGNANRSHVEYDCDRYLDPSADLEDACCLLEDRGSEVIRCRQESIELLRAGLWTRCPVDHMGDPVRQRRQERCLYVGRVIAGRQQQPDARRAQHVRQAPPIVVAAEGDERALDDDEDHQGRAEFLGTCRQSRGDTRETTVEFKTGIKLLRKGREELNHGFSAKDARIAEQ